MFICFLVQTFKASMSGREAKAQKFHAQYLVFEDLNLKLYEMKPQSFTEQLLEVRNSKIYLLLLQKRIYLNNKKRYYKIWYKIVIK